MIQSLQAIFQILLFFSITTKWYQDVRTSETLCISMEIWEKKKSPQFCESYSISHLDPPPREAKLWFPI